MKKLIYGSLLFTLFSCSSLSEKVIAKMDEKERPKWASQSKIINEDGDKITFLGFVETDIDAKLSAVMRVADHAARAELSKMVNTKFSSLLQNLEEGLSDGGELVRFYSTEISKNTLQEAKLTSRYWEKIQTFDQEGEKVYRLRSYSLLEVSKNKFRKIVQNSVNNERISPEIKNEIIDQFKALTGEMNN